MIEVAGNAPAFNVQNAGHSFGSTARVQIEHGDAREIRSVGIRKIDGQFHRTAEVRHLAEHVGSAEIDTDLITRTKRCGEMCPVCDRVLRNDQRMAGESEYATLRI